MHQRKGKKTVFLCWSLQRFWSNIFLSMASVTIIFGRLICWEAFIMPCQIDRTEKRQPGIFKSFVLLRTVISRLKMTMSVLFGRNQLYRVSWGLQSILWLCNCTWYNGAWRWIYGESFVSGCYQSPSKYYRYFKSIWGWISWRSRF